MKVSLICTETRDEIIPEATMTFVNAYGHQDGETITIPAHTVHYHKGTTFTARNKKDVASALATGIWKVNS